MYNEAMIAKQPAFHRADPDVRRQSLIDACARILAKRGGHGASVRTICAEAGVSPGLLRHYFDGIAILARALLKHLKRQSLLHPLPHARACSPSSPRAFVRQLLTLIC
jgi:AcrR family transcriptional regulator